jgi:hypothetical protein
MSFGLDERADTAVRELQGQLCDTREALDSIASGLGMMLVEDLGNHDLLQKWGWSRADHIPEPFLTYCSRVSGLGFVPNRSPAGIVHTYGYLLSADSLSGSAKKRSRWTHGTVAKVFGQPAEWLLGGPETFLSLVSSIALRLIDPTGRTREKSAHEISSHSEHDPRAGWHGMWNVFRTLHSERIEQEPDAEGHLLIYRVGSSHDSLSLSTVFPVRRRRCLELSAAHRSDGPRLRFNAVYP